MRAISSLNKLEVFHFPRCSPLKADYEGARYDDGEEYPDCWYPSLKAVHIPCSLSDGYLPAFRSMPSSMTFLTIENSSHVANECLMSISSALGHQIQSLRLRYSGLQELRDVSSLSISQFPNLRHLGLTADFETLLTFIWGPNMLPSRCQLESIALYIDRTTMNFDSLCVDELFDQAEYFPNLRLVVATMQAGFPLNPLLREDLDSLQKLLEKRESERADSGAAAKRKHSRTGVWVFNPEDLPAQY